MGCKKIDEKELKGEKNEIKRLYNYTYELLDEIINSIIKLGKSLGFKVVAEYVETEEQSDKLLNILFIIGFLLATAAQGTSLAYDH